MMSGEFLTALFGEKPEDFYILIWTLQGKRSRFFKDIADAESFIGTAKARSDVYVGVGLAREEYGEFERVKNANVAGIGGFWLDIDVKSPHHKKQNLPPTDDDAIEFIQSLHENLQPSVIIHSGNGIQAWWMFREPWIFESPEDRQAAEMMAKRFIYTFKLKAREKGWDVDSVIDLARVLRIPDTLNHKSNPPKPVRGISHDRRLRYDPTEFEPYLIGEDELPANTAKSTTNSADTEGGGWGDFVLDPRANPPFDKFEALRDIEIKFGQSWDRTRRDMKDQSASSYDLSLASFAALANWTDQEIVDMLIASRRKHGDDLKLRADYYGRTIKRSRSFIEKSKAQEAIDDFSIEDQSASDKPDASRKKELRQYLSALFGVEIIRIVKYLSDPPTYRLETDAGNIMLGEVGNLIDQMSFRKKVASASDVYIPRFKGERWDGIAQALLHVCESEGIGDEATVEGTAAAWIESYLEEKNAVDIDELPDTKEIVSTRAPYIKEGRTYIFGTDLRKWLKVSQMENITTREMGTILRAYGAIPDKLNITQDGNRTSKSVWLLPQK